MTTEATNAGAVALVLVLTGLILDYSTVTLDHAPLMALSRVLPHDHIFMIYISGVAISGVGTSDILFVRTYTRTCP